MSESQARFAQEACAFRLSINLSNGWIFLQIDTVKIKVWHEIPSCVLWHDGDDRRMPKLQKSHELVLGITVYPDDLCVSLCRRVSLPIRGPTRHET